ncbi:MAG TPA: ATP-binding protein [Gemmatimonadaceae bacterium]|nr:ATP-binding protein [Gemmatimonadaceae bacterium]
MVSERRAPIRHERRVLTVALVGGLPAVILSLVLLWSGDHSGKVRWTFAVILIGVWLGAAFSLQAEVVRPLQTLSNILAALREEDFSIRARGARDDDALGLAFLEANILGETLRSQRLGAMEAVALMRTVMEEIDVAVFAFDETRTLRLVNRAGERLLGRSAEQLVGRSAEAVGLGEPLGDEEGPRTLDLVFPGGAGRWEARVSTFRQDGRPHQLLVLADLSRALREEEVQAWQRLVRVLSHEINNSLAPIKSVAGSLQAIVRRTPRPPDWDTDLQRGLKVIEGRSDALSQFIASYARLTRLPPPQKGRVDVDEWVRRVAALETRLSVRVRSGPRAVIDADGKQLDQLLINLVRNAVDASLETGGGVEVGWARANGFLDVSVLDEGPGLSSTANLFVPFFTTKPSGSGIGLALSRQIAEAHGGTLSLENRADRQGCEARLRLPVA